jgi:hypothetical protein
VENGCEVAEYNLAKNGDFVYFVGKKYHELTLALLPYIEVKAEAIFYMLLVGTSSQMP